MFVKASQGNWVFAFLIMSPKQVDKAWKFQGRLKSNIFFISKQFANFIKSGFRA